MPKPASSIAIGDHYGHLRVIAEVGIRNRRRRYRCACSCGAITEVNGKDMKTGHTTSCGCRKGSVKHGHARHRLGGKTPTYQSWAGMIARCCNPNSAQFSYYGGRGITVCERWRSFEHFLADMGERPAGTSIDRVDNDGNYDAGNCRWATPSEQGFNRRRAAFHDAPKDYGERTCAHCATPFTARHPQGRFCSPRCKGQWHYIHRVKKKKAA